MDPGDYIREPAEEDFGDRVARGLRNALEVARLGRLGAPYHAPYRVVHQDRVFRLRRYGEDGRVPTVPAPVLLVPPLMVTSEVYDIDPEVSAVQRLLDAGLDVWVIDFGAPEREEGGMERTLDDHVRGVDRAVDAMRAATGRDVHLAGYSQGGMFVYQVAAYRRSAGLASLITFGSPVDIHRNIPNISDSAAAPMLRAARNLLEWPLEKAEGLPGFLTSTAFKMLSPMKEVTQIADFVRKLHDRQALEKRESRRRFLGGEGFVAWPGPALRKFVDEFVVHNRLASGGFVLDGRTATLGDIRVPILYFVGEKDAIAHPPSIRAIRRAAPNAKHFEVPIRAGHFGLVVGSRATSQTWPTVIQWIRWREGVGARPTMLADSTMQEPLEPEDAAFAELQVDLELFFGAISTGVRNAWKRLGELTTDAADAVDAARWQVPRLRKLRTLEPDERISSSLLLAEQAEKIPEQTFFLWMGRAFTYGDADRRVDAVVRGLIRSGVRPEDRVAVFMHSRPSLLSMVSALIRLGAIPVLIDPEEKQLSLEDALALGDARILAVDPDHVERARGSIRGQILVLGGGADTRDLGDGVIDMEAINPDTVELPAWYEPNPGRARDVALVMFTGGLDGAPRPVRITHRRWAFSAYGAAAACTLSPRDTVYCCLRLHHASGLLVAVGAALVAGSRLAVATQFTPDDLWREVRRYGATVVFYAGEMARALVDAPPSSSDRVHPVRLFAGSGMPRDVWRRVVGRFGVGVLEFYASSEGNLVLANASGKKVGGLGHPLPGSADVELLAYDFESDAIRRDRHGHAVRAREGEPGMLVWRVDGAQLGAFAGGPPDDGNVRKRVRRDLFEEGDAWFVTGDLLRRDVDGDYELVDRVADVVRSAHGPVITREVEEALLELPWVRQAVVYGVRPSHDQPAVAMAALVLHEGQGVDVEALGRHLASRLPREARPDYVRVVPRIELTDGYRPRKAPLQAEGIPATAGPGTLFRHDASGDRYAAVTVEPIDDDRRSTS